MKFNIKIILKRISVNQNLKIPIPLFLALLITFTVIYPTLILLKQNIVDEILKIYEDERNIDILSFSGANNYQSNKRITNEDIKKIKRVKGVKSIVPFVRLETKYNYKGKDFEIVFHNPRYKVQLISGRELNQKNKNNDEVLVYDDLAKKIGVSVGDSFIVKAPTYIKKGKIKENRNKLPHIEEPIFDKDLKLHIVGIVKQENPLPSAFNFGYGIMSLSKILSLNEEFKTGYIHVSISLPKGYKTEKVIDKLNSIFKGKIIFTDIKKDDIQRIFRNPEIKVIIYGLLISIILISATAILTFYHFSWRNRYILQKVIDFKKKCVANWKITIFFLLEIITSVIFTSILGLIMGVSFFKTIISSEIEKTFHFTTNISIAPLDYIIFFAIGVSSVLLILIIPAFINSRIPLQHLILLSDENYLRGKLWKIKKLNQLPLRYMKTKAVTSIITIITIALGIGMVFAVSISNKGMSAETEIRMEEHMGKSHLIIKPAKENISFSEDILRKIRETKGVKAASYRAKLFFVGERNGREFPIEIRAIDPKIEKEIKDYTIYTFSMTMNNGQVSHQLFDREKFFKFKQPGTIVISDNLVMRYKYNMNEIVLLKKFLSNYASSGNKNIKMKPLKFRIIGETSGEYSEILNTELGFININDLKNYNKFPPGTDKSEVAVRVVSSANIFNTQNFLKKKPGDNYSVIDTKDFVKFAAYHPLVVIIQTCMMIISFLALLISANLVSNIFVMNVKNRMKEIGILRSLGAKKNQIFSLFFREALYFGVIGSLSGIIIGLLLSTIIIKITEKNWFGHIPFKISINWLLISIGLGLTVTIISALKPAYKASRMSPSEASRPGTRSFYSRGKNNFIYISIISLITSFPLIYFNFSEKMKSFFIGAGVFLAFIGFILAVPFLIPLLSKFIGAFVLIFYRGEGYLAQTYINWNRTRSAVSIIAAASAAVLITVVGGVEDFHQKFVDDFINRQFGGDIVFLSYNSQKEMRKDISKIKEVEFVTYIKSDRINISNENFNVHFIEPDNFFKIASYIFFEGNIKTVKKQLLEGGNLLLSRNLSSRLGKVTGDKIFINTPAGKVKFKVAGIILGFYDYSPEIVLSYADYQKHFHGSDATAFLIKVKEKKNIRTVHKKVEKIFKGKGLDCYSLTPDEKMENIKNDIRRSTNGFKSSYYIVLVVVVIILFNTLFLNIRERTREIGILRAVGASKRKIQKMILAESCIMCLSGLIIGTITGVYSLQGFIKVTEIVIGIPSRFVFPGGAIITSLIITLIIYIIGGFIPAIKASSIDVADALRYE